MEQLCTPTQRMPGNLLEKGVCKPRNFGATAAAASAGKEAIAARWIAKVAPFPKKQTFGSTDQDRSRRVAGTTTPFRRRIAPPWLFGTETNAWLLLLALQANDVTANSGFFRAPQSGGCSFRCARNC